MRVLVVSREFPPHVVGGLSYHLASLYRATTAAGHDVTVLAGRCREATTDSAPLAPEEVDIRWVPYGTFHGHHLSFPAALAVALRSIDTGEYDAAVTHTQIPYNLGLPTVGKLHDCPREERPLFRQELSFAERVVDSVLDPTRRIVERRSLDAADYLLYNSALTRRAWERHYDIQTSGTVIHNGVDRSTFTPDGSAASPVDGPYVLFVGDSYRKGIDRVLAYASDAPETVCVVGPERLSGDSVRALGRVSQSRLAALYRGATATVHPARFEAFGNVILESLACGTPVVTTRRCGASELLTDDAGVVGTDLATGVSAVRDTSTAACTAVAEDRKWNRVASETIEVLERLSD